QQKRHQVMDDFSRGQYQILITTDIASRGLDLAQVSHVFNFDLPKHAEEYVHRIGRTGRAGATGLAIAYVGPKDWGSYLQLRSFLKQVDNFDTVATLPATFKGRPQKTKSNPKVTPSGSKSARQQPSQAKRKPTPKRSKTFHNSQEVGHLPIKKKK
ncbi:MAG: DEAD/DEAH box helicase, partial [Shewanellaceae bacterium]|nr:DEAD/DEAH box helicase [Shewanellaceae bacterium]